MWVGDKILEIFYHRPQLMNYQYNTTAYQSRKFIFISLLFFIIMIFSLFELMYMVNNRYKFSVKHLIVQAINQKYLVTSKLKIANK